MTKKLITIVLLAFAIFSLGFLVTKEISHNGSQNETAITDSKDTNKKTEKPDKIIKAYYFHATKRCPTCLEIESHAKEAIEETYTNELENGLLEWEVINYEDWGNKHFVDDYDLMYSSLILSEQSNGNEIRWKNLDSIWDFAWEPEVFIPYVQRELNEFLYSQNTLNPKPNN